MRKTTLAAVFALLVAALPLAATTATPVSAQADSTAKVRVINALGTTDSDTKEGDGPDAEVSVSCDTGTGEADIPVIQPGGPASEGSADFVVNSGTCKINVETDDFSCGTPGGGPKQLNFAAGGFYTVVIEPEWTDGSTTGAFPIDLTGCKLKLWEDDGSILPPNTARFTVRHAACETGYNLHITSVEADGAQIMGAINDCSDATVELPAGFHNFVINAFIDVNGDGDPNEEFLAFSTDCDGYPAALAGLDGNYFDPEDCPEVVEKRITVPLNNISLAAGESFTFNFVDDGTGQYIPLLVEGLDPEDYDTIPSDFSDYDCNQYNGNFGAYGYGPPTVLAGPVYAPGCTGGGIGVNAGPATVRVLLDGNLLPASNAALKAFCDNIITKFQSTIAAETDYIKTLTVVDKTDTTLQAYVEATNALIQTLLTEAPLDIRPAIVTLTSGLTQLNQGLTAAGYNTKTLGAANLLKIQNGLANPAANPETEAARATLTSWITGNCFASAADGVPTSAKFTG